MPLLYQPKPGSVVMCDFHGFTAPEMVKTRPVVILAKHKHNNQLVTVVPLSTTAPHTVEDHHHELSTNPLPDEPDYVQVYAKCDMIYTVALARLDRYKIRTRKGREYVIPVLSAPDFAGVQQAVASALGI